MFTIIFNIINTFTFTRWHSRSWEIINYKYLFLKVASLGAYALEARICVRRASNIFGRLFFFFFSLAKS